MERERNRRYQPAFEQRGDSPVLSPQRAFRSVHGASNTSRTNRLIHREAFKESRACESFVCDASFHGFCVHHTPPPDFGISFRLTDVGLYFALWIASVISLPCSMSHGSASSTVIPSTPGAPLFAFRRVPRRPPRQHTFLSLRLSAASITCDSVQLLGFDLLCGFTLAYTLLCGFCSSGQRFARG